MNELGGEFHWLAVPEETSLRWPVPHTWFSTGRAAVVQLAQQVTCRHLWVPEYFCPHTTQYWRDSGLEVISYVDHPHLAQPDWATLKPLQREIVVAVNYFGVRAATPWRVWQTQHPNVILLEDHTHDPFSAWAIQSNADYAFASLRKTFPIPDGAILWSPAGHSLPAEPQGEHWVGSALKLAAMIWKKQYIDSGEASTALKPIFRQFQIEGEKILAEIADQKIAPWSRVLVDIGFPTSWRQRRIENVHYFLERLPTSKHLQPLFDTWPEEHCPFNAVLVTDTRKRRDALRQYLITAGIYAPVHWQLPPGASEEAQDIACRTLTVPVDFRYTLRELDTVLSVIQEFLRCM
jgi:hypothetical protein